MKKPKNTIRALLGRTLIFFSILWAIPVFAGGEAASISLADALEKAMAANPSLAAAVNQREAAEARMWEAKSGFFPQLSLLAGYTYYQEPNIIIPIHQPGVFPPLDNQIYETSLQLKMPLFNGGRTSASTRAAKAAVEESQARQDFVQFSLLEGIGQVFIQALQLEDNRRLVTARIKSLQQRRREMSLLLKEGRVSPADLALVNASIESARADSIEIESQQVELAYRLGQLLGLKKPLHPAIAGMESINGKKGQYAFGVHGAADIAGPVVLTAQAQLARTEAAKSAANSSFWPEISAFGAYSYRSGSNLDMIGEWAAGITLRFPLFEGGRRIAGRNAAQASLRAAEENLKSARQEQEAFLQIARERQQSARIRRDYIEHAAENKARSVAAQQEMYKAGRVALGDLLVQETELLQLHIQERALAYAEMLAVLNYHAVAGMLTPEKVQAIVRSIP